MDFFLPTHAAVMVGGVGYVCHGCHGQKMVWFPIGMVIQPLIRTDFDTYCKDDHIWGWMTTNHIPCGWPWHMWIAKVVEWLNWLLWFLLGFVDIKPAEMGWQWTYLDCNLTFRLYTSRRMVDISNMAKDTVLSGSQIVSHSHIRRYDDILWYIMISYNVLCYILM